jgi:hypothetical protein
MCLTLVSIALQNEILITSGGAEVQLAAITLLSNTVVKLRWVVKFLVGSHGQFYAHCAGHFQRRTAWPDN